MISQVISGDISGERMQRRLDHAGNVGGGLHWPWHCRGGFLHHDDDYDHYYDYHDDDHENDYNQREGFTGPGIAEEVFIMINMVMRMIKAMNMLMMMTMTITMMMAMTNMKQW